MTLAYKMPYETRALSYSDMSETQLIEERNNLIENMENLISKGKQERRALSGTEENEFRNHESEIKEIDQALKGKNSSKGEMRNAKGAGRTNSPLEVRGYSKNERIGSGLNNVSVGDLIYSHITGRYRNEEVREALSTTSGGLSIPTEVYKDFIDALRNQSFLGETTLYPMATQTFLSLE